MANIRFNLFPGGRHAALTFSYDDGREQDRGLVAMLNQYGLRATFHLVSGLLDMPGHITSAEVPALYRGHEVACHTCTHPFLNQMPPRMAHRELLEDKAALEKLTDFPVRGLSWPFGAWDETAVQAARLSGLAYSRTTRATGGLNLPENWMLWHPTAHQSEPLPPLLDKLLDDHRADMRLCMIWGHSYELDDSALRQRLEAFCAAAAHRPEIWYATCIEVWEYADALHRLVFDADLTTAYNPSAVPVWFSADGEPVRLDAGKTWRQKTKQEEL